MAGPAAETLPRPAHQAHGVHASLHGLEFAASFLWDYLKDRVYKEQLRITEALKTTIAAESARLLSKMADRSVSPLQTVRGAAAGDNSPKVARIEHLL